MPLYDFKCEKCNAVREEIVSCEQKTLTCKCGSEMERMPGNFSFKAFGCPSYDARLGASMREKNISKRKKQYHDRGKPLPAELQNM